MAQKRFHLIIKGIFVTKNSLSSVPIMMVVVLSVIPVLVVVWVVWTRIGRSRGSRVPSPHVSAVLTSVPASTATTGRWTTSSHVFSYFLWIISHCVTGRRKTCLSHYRNSQRTETWFTGFGSFLQQRKSNREKWAATREIIKPTLQFFSLLGKTSFLLQNHIQILAHFSKFLMLSFF